MDSQNGVLNDYINIESTYLEAICEGLPFEHYALLEAAFAIHQSSKPLQVLQAYILRNPNGRHREIAKKWGGLILRLAPQLPRRMAQARQRLIERGYVQFELVDDEETYKKVLEMKVD